jgi:hypothetical protein
VLIYIRIAAHVVLCHLSHLDFIYQTSCQIFDVTTGTYLIEYMAHEALRYWIVLAVIQKEVETRLMNNQSVLSVFHFLHYHGYLLDLGY